MLILLFHMDLSKYPCLKGIENQQRGESWKEESNQQYGTRQEHQQYGTRKEAPQQHETRKEVPQQCETEQTETESRPHGKTLEGGEQHREETYGVQEGKGDGGVLGAIGETIVEIAQTTKDLVIGEDQTRMESNLGDQNEQNRQWGNTHEGK